MGVHSLHIFDRRGSTLFTKRYGKTQPGQSNNVEQLSEQRKLVFGMLFSLREMVGNLAPANKGKDPGKVLGGLNLRSEPIRRAHTNSHAMLLIHLRSPLGSNRGCYIALLWNNQWHSICPLYLQYIRPVTRSSSISSEAYLYQYLGWLCGPIAVIHVEYGRNNGYLVNQLWAYAGRLFAKYDLVS